MNQDLGSDAWFNWQFGLLENNPSSPFRAAENKEALFTAQRMLFDLSDMHPPEKDSVGFVEQLLAKGHPVMVLTARNPDVLGATFRELDRAGYGFAKTAPNCGDVLCAKTCGTGSARCSTPRLISDAAVVAASERAKNCFKFPALAADAKPITYLDGVMMANSQDKGAILQLLLASENEDCMTKLTWLTSPIAWRNGIGRRENIRRLSLSMTADGTPRTLRRPSRSSPIVNGTNSTIRTGWPSSSTSTSTRM
jgi:hypothetical protein